jgi:hypothetical protein
MKIVVVGVTGLIGAKIVERRHVVAEEDALYFGVKLNDQSLVPGANGRLSPTSFDEWFRHIAREKK